MEFCSKRRAEQECGPANALSPAETRRMIKLANISHDDIFYDLGSGYGRVVRTVVERTSAKQAVGIENDPERFCKTITIMKRCLTKRQQKRTEFLCANYEYVDISPATVVYHGLSETPDDIHTYEKWFKSKQVKIVKTDLPLVSYKAIGKNGSGETPLFLMKCPLQQYKTLCKDEWASHVLDKENATIKDLYSYYYNLLKGRGFKGRDLNRFLDDLKKLVKLRFSK